MMDRGLARRKTNETKMNAESSRSHAVLTLHLESSTRTDLGLLAVKSSRLNLVDLAGTATSRTLLLWGRVLESRACGGSMHQGDLCIIRPLRVRAWHKNGTDLFHNRFFCMAPKEQSDLFGRENSRRC